ncbi:uncharacterized protein LOC124141800 [Haliotis rufescens]|uniref:uncharacterized protein LOC124141800 n=1 Tax=Haliotis rufescens TaxID=6454 RepID=UPI00201E8800|nr:uncharacterized protein LOC124141800 [Haliotis rufescens]
MSYFFALHLCVMDMKGMWTWPFVLVLGVLGLGQGEGVEMSQAPLASPPPPRAGLYSVLLKLQRQVADMEQVQEKDRTRLRRMERRTRQYRDTMIKAEAEVVQLRQHIVELRERFGAIEEQSTNIKLDITRLDFQQRETKHEMTLVKDARPFEDDHVFEVRHNMSQLMSVKEDLFQSYVSLMEDVQGLRKKEKTNSDSISKLQNRYGNVVKILKVHVKDQRRHGRNVNRLELNQTNDSLVWTNEDLDSGDGSGDMSFESRMSRPNTGPPDAEEGSGDGDGVDVDTLLPTLNTSSVNGVNVVDLEDRLQVLEQQVKGKLDNADREELEARIKDLLKTHDSYFEQEILKRDTDIENVEQQMVRMGEKIHGVESRVLSIQLGDFMQKLQESLINFTQNVITLDQWKMASDQIINSTQFNQQQIAQMTNMILNNSRAVGQMDWKMTDQRLLSDQQYRVLRMHIIRLNNSVQDLREHVEYLGSIKSGSPTTAHQQPGYTPPSGDVMSRVEDLALQIIYNENRIANLESKVLNQTLFQCQKSSKDLYQDGRLLTLEKEMSAMTSQGLLLSEMIKRVDRALYRVHSNCKNNTVFLHKLWSKAATWQLYMPIISLVQQEVTNLLTTVPTDCDGYYKRGFLDSGKYIIYPKGALQSVFVYCSMEADGGWTLIQKRVHGKENFSRSWAEYAIGFGSAEDEFWVGNEFIHLMTTHDNYSLRIEMTDVFDGYWFVEYDEFAISTKEENYKLRVHGFHGNATDGMDYSNDMAFSTQDKDNDLSSTHCALYFTSGWWYRHCQYSNLNGRYDTGIVWFNSDWQDWIQMKTSVMKIKPRL